jgi:hypothetical protein
MTPREATMLTMLCAELKAGIDSNVALSRLDECSEHTRKVGQAIVNRDETVPGVKAILEWAKL